MGNLGMFAVVACLASLGVKWFFSLQSASLEKSIEVERQSCQEAKRGRDLAVHRNKVLIAEYKQLEGRKNTTKRSIARNDKIYQGLAEQEQEEEQTKARQKELLDLKKKPR